MLTGRERMIIDEAREEVYRLHLTGPNDTFEACLAVPTAEPNLEPHDGEMPFFFFFGLFVLLGPHPRHMEVLRLGV